MTQTASRVQIRLLSMSTADLQRFMDYAGVFNHTDEQDARTASHKALVAAELAKREVAS